MSDEPHEPDTALERRPPSSAAMAAVPAITFECIVRGVHAVRTPDGKCVARIVRHAEDLVNSLYEMEPEGMHEWAIRLADEHPFDLQKISPCQGAYTLGQAKDMLLRAVEVPRPANPQAASRASETARGDSIARTPAAESGIRRALRHLDEAQKVVDDLCDEMSGHHDAVLLRYQADTIRQVRATLDAFPTISTVEAV